MSDEPKDGDLMVDGDIEEWTSAEALSNWQAAETHGPHAIFQYCSGDRVEGPLPFEPVSFSISVWRHFKKSGRQERRTMYLWPSSKERPFYSEHEPPLGTVH